MNWPCMQIGRPQNPPMVFLHGFMGSGADWLPVAKRISDQFFCILPDLPGHGQNTQLNFNKPLTFDAVSTALSGFLSTVEKRPICLVGYSMGGRIALYFALEFPAVVTTLVLEGANPGLVGAEARRMRAELDRRRAEQLQQMGLDAFIDAWYTMPLFNSLQARPRLLQATKARRRQNNGPWLAKVIRELSPGRQPSLWPHLERLTMPVALVIGALDAKYTALNEEMAAKILHSKLFVVPQAGHNVHLEQPARFAQLLTKFLRQV